MPSFKKLLRHSWHFAKKNWKALINIFLPIEIALFLLTMLLVFGLNPARFLWVAVLAGIFAFIFAITRIFKRMVVFSGGLLLSQIESGEEKGIKRMYKDVLTQTMPIAWVAILQCLYMFAVSALAFLASVIIFFLPFLIFGLVSRVYPDAMYFINENGSAITTGMLIISLIFFAISNIFFGMKVWFSSYTLLIEGRDGIDALADSAMLTRGRSWNIFWRMLVIGIISLLPILIILGPIYVEILIQAVKQMAVAFALGLRPVFPPIAADLLFWRSALALMANLVWTPIFVTLNYFLWKDIKATAPAFEESTYTKTRKRIKICIWAGLVLAVLAAIGSVFASI